jgi:hypothetical protein
MNHLNKAAVVFAIYLLTMICGAVEKDVMAFEAKSIKVFTQVTRSSGVFLPDFEFSASEEKYEISSDGRGRRIEGKALIRPFNLQIDRGFSLGRIIYFTEYKNDILLLCEGPDGYAGRGFIARLDGLTLKIKWKARIPGFHVGQGVIEGNCAYLTAVGYIEKIDLETGACVWKHDSLCHSCTHYFQHLSTAFELPRIEEDTVVFPAREQYSGIAKTITVDKMSGKILSVSN